VSVKLTRFSGRKYSDSISTLASIDLTNAGELQRNTEVWRSLQHFIPESSEETSPK